MSQSDLSSPTICIAENRASCEPALRILVASLVKHVPTLDVLMFCPEATPSFTAWLDTFDRVRLNPAPLISRWNKYDIKPLAILTILGLGVENVLWIDSDMLVARDFRPIFADLPSATLAVAEEALMDGHDDPDGLRARLWGMPVGRSLPFTANSCIVRATPAHRALLQAWHELLQSEPYLAAQAGPWNERPPHLAGDQEVLTALLASERFADVPLRLLRRGRDIVQFFGVSGYTVGERLRHLRHGMPPFVHSMGFRPWWPEPAPTQGFAARFRYLYHALSPYTVLARGYADVLEDDGWLRSPTRAASLLTSRRPALSGLPLAVIADMARGARALRTRRSDKAPS